MGGPVVSVCVPTYNRVQYLEPALATLRAQTFTDFELLVVDNASTDGTERLIAGLDDRRLRYHRGVRNVGSIANWNRCLDVAAGELVAICHDDDLYEPDFLARAVGMLQARPTIAFVHTAAQVIDVSGRPLRTYRAYPRDTVARGVDVFVRYLTHSHDVVMSTVVARRACYEAAGRFTPELLCADFEMWLKLALHGDVGYVASPLVGYRTHAESTSLRMDPARWYHENEDIVRRAVGWARERIPGIERREAEFVAATRHVWARRTLTEALAAAAAGHLVVAGEYLEVARSLSTGGRERWITSLAAALMNPLAARLLRGVRGVRRRLRRVA